MKVPYAVLASGSGTNMQSLLDHEDHGAAYRIEVLIVDRPCAAEERARAKGRAVYRVDFGSRSAGAEVVGLLERHGVRGVLLAGFLKLLPPEVCRAFEGRILNIHPALLPAFGGKGMYGHHVHEAVLRSGASVSGPTIHFVNERYDEGRILAQWPVPVEPDDTAGSLAARVLEVEHLLFPAAADALARADLAAPAFRWPGTGVQAGRDLRESIATAFGGAGE
ncbi:MAG: phosphoribosylglycinamide formyltransferase [Gemmatimonadota bacterium]|nr:phosphoribosylglycinamide formyltransferase [Gemmatimonadota bacterium]MDE2983884.1 phosphoribosylglycinamide formyltransferase [Gemmatimonadota bacterium]